MSTDQAHKISQRILSKIIKLVAMQFLAILERVINTAYNGDILCERVNDKFWGEVMA